MGPTQYASNVFCLLLCTVVGYCTAAKAPKCVPQDWTSISNYLDFGTCNWPSSKTPCGPAVDVPQKPKGQRAWPSATCTLKFSRTPWAPEIFPQERDSGWVCGTLWQKCTRISTPQLLSGNAASPGKNGSTTAAPGSVGFTSNTTAVSDGLPSPYDCGGTVAGTDRPCPSDGWTCEPTFKVYSNSNCKSNGDDLVLDVSSMGYPNAVANSRVSDPVQCQQMCTLRTGCNTWNFCNSTQGCGWSCQDYLDNFPGRKKNRESFWSTTGFWIVVAVVSALLLLAVIVILLVCRRRRNQFSKGQQPSSIPMQTPGLTPAISDAQSTSKSISGPEVAQLGHPATSVGMPAAAHFPPQYHGVPGQPYGLPSQMAAAPVPDPTALWTGPYVGHASQGVTTPLPPSHSQGSSLIAADSAAAAAGYPAQGGQVNVVMGQVPAGAPVLSSTAGSWPSTNTASSPPTHAAHPRRFQFTGGSEDGSQVGQEGPASPGVAAAARGWSPNLPGTHGRPASGYTGADHIVLGTS